MKATLSRAEKVIDELTDVLEAAGQEYRLTRGDMDTTELHADWKRIVVKLTDLAIAADEATWD